MAKQKLVKISDSFSISDAVTSISTKIKEQIPNMISDAASSASRLSLLSEAQVTHGGIVNANYGYYKPEKLQASVPSWTAPYGKPVLVHHDKMKDNVGRVVGSQYKSSVPTFVPKIKNSVYQTDFSYRGLGYIQNLLSISDADAVDKVLDGRYLTLSVHGDNDAMECSICNQEWVNDGKCYHRFGDFYENDRTGEEELCYWKAGNFLWDEVSFVNEPADPFAQIITRELIGEAKDEVLQTYQYKDVTKSDKQVSDTAKRMVKFYVVNDSKGAILEINDSTDLRALYKIYDVHRTPVGIDMKSQDKEHIQVADTTKPAAPEVAAATAVTAPEATPAPKIEDQAPAAVAPIVDTKPEAAKVETVVDTKTVPTAAVSAPAPKIEDQIKVAVTDATKPLEDKIKEQETSLTKIADEKKALEDQTTTLQSQIRDFKMDQILDLKEVLGTDSYPTVEDRKKAKDAMLSRSIQSIEDQIKDLQESIKKNKRPSPANVVIGDAGAKAPTIQDSMLNALSNLKPEQVMAMKLSGKLNFPEAK